MNNIAQKRTFPRKLLTPKETRILKGLIETDSLKAAAAAACVSRGTVYAALKNPDFVEQLEVARAATFDEALKKLRASSGRAVARLCAIMDSSDIGEARRAATSILGLTLRSAELIDVEKRISELERRIASRPSDGKNCKNRGGGLD